MLHLGPQTPLQSPVALPDVVTDKFVAKCRKDLERAQAALEKASAASRDLPLSATRAARARAGNRYTTAAEERDRCRARLEAAEAQLVAEAYKLTTTNRADAM